MRVSGVRVGDIAEVRAARRPAIVTMDLDQEYEDLVARERDRAAAPEDRAEGHVPRARRRATPERAGRRGGLDDPDLQHAARRQPGRVPRRARRRHARLPPAAAQRRARRASRAAARPPRGAPALRADLPRPRARCRRRSPSARVELRRLVNSLDDAQHGAGARKDDDLAELVDAVGAQCSSALASERANVSADGARAARHAAARRRRRSARSSAWRAMLGPAADELRPAVRALRRRQRGATAVRARGDAAAARRHPPVRARGAPARPRPRARRRATSSRPAPDLTRTFAALNHLFNMLAYNPSGREGPDRHGRDEGYLFYLAWLAHQRDAASSPRQDAHGVLPRRCSARHLRHACRRRVRRAAGARVPARPDRVLDRPARCCGQPQATDEQDAAPSTARARARWSLLRAVVLRAAAVPVADLRRADPAQAEGLPLRGRVPRGDAARRAGRRARRRRAVGKVVSAERDAAAATARSRRSRSSASTRRPRATRARCCARRRCSARRTSS